MLAALGGGLCAAINLVTMKTHRRRSDPFVLNFFGMGFGAACPLGMSAALERWSAVVWTRDNVLGLVYLSVFGLVIASWAYYGPDQETGRDDRQPDHAHHPNRGIGAGRDVPP